jgi:hypothetical protein
MHYRFAVRRFAVLLGLIGPIAGSAFAQDRGDLRLESKGAAAKYRKQWALVIGINYNGISEEVAKEGVAELKNAESDANAFADVLLEHYGYKKWSTEDPTGTLRVLIGKEATFLAIRDLLGSDFLASSDVSEEDSALVYFSGHGSKYIKGDWKNGLLYPFDIQRASNGGIKETRCISLAWLKEQLERYCSARHKLIMLDSCYSGEIFNDESRSRSGSLHVNQIDPSAFKSGVVQALAAARDSQTASDGTVRGNGDTGHSPFTGALLDSLQREIPAQVFGASYVANRVAHKLHADESKQSPIDGRLVGNGEFYFFRTTAAEAEAAERADVALATLPGLFGRWWFDELPELVPSLRANTVFWEGRYQLAARTRSPNNEQGPSAHWLNDPAVDELYKRLAEAIDEFPKEGNRQRETYQTLMELNSVDAQQLPANVLEQIDNLHDPHLSAAARHWLGKDAAQSYRAALDAYEKQLEQKTGTERMHWQALMSRCYADYARWLSDNGQPFQAFNNYQNAFDILPAGSSAPLFEVELLCCEADVQRKMAQWDEAAESLERALDIARKNISDRHPFTAHVHDRFAWLYMDQWALGKAEQHFRLAVEARERIQPASLPVQVGLFHAEHGLAMAQRFGGRNEDATRRYSELAERIADTLKQAESPRDAEILRGRSLNTLERLADCYLLTATPQPSPAYDAIQQARELCQGMRGSQQNQLIRLRSKQAIALALAGYADGAAEELDAIRQGPEAQVAEAKQFETDLLWKVAAAVVALKRDKDNTSTALQFRELLDSKLTEGEREKLNRQDLELLLFAANLFVQSQAERGARETARDADRLLAIVPKSFANESVMPFLRPYYDTAIRAKLAHVNPLELSAMARTIVLAKTADHDYRIPTDSAALVFFLGEQNGHAILCPPSAAKGTRPQLFPLPFGQKNLENAELPAELLAAMASLNGTVEWRDSFSNPPITNESFPFKLPSGWTLASQETQQVQQ